MTRTEILKIAENDFANKDIASIEYLTTKWFDKEISIYLTRIEELKIKQEMGK